MENNLKFDKHLEINFHRNGTIADYKLCIYIKEIQDYSYEGYDFGIGTNVMLSDIIDFELPEKVVHWSAKKWIKELGIHISEDKSKMIISHLVYYASADLEEDTSLFGKILDVKRKTKK